MSIDLAALAKRAGGKFDGKDALIPGPGHSKADRSLSLAIGRKGQLIAHSFAGDDHAAINAHLKSLGVDVSSARDSSEALRVSERAGHAKANAKAIAATYDYTDADGRLIFQVVRYKYPKTFSQRRPNPERPGAWLWNKESVARVPYRLPDLIAAIKAGETIFIAEGEKDVDNLRALGLAATCNDGGAGKWTKALSAHLRGADVAILPDNDKAGREHAEEVRAALEGVAAKVRVIALPDLPEKGDVSDWLDAGGTEEELLRLARQPRAAEAKAKGHAQLARQPRRAAQEQVFAPVFPDRKGDKPAQSYMNARVALTALDLKFAFDRFANRMFVNGAPLGEYEGDFSDKLLVVLRQAVINRFGFDAGDRHVKDATLALCLENSFDPVCEYLDDVQANWDGKPRLDVWLTTYCQAKDTPLNRAFAAKTLIAGVRRARQPGCKFDFILTLESSDETLEGEGKSSACLTLAGSDDRFSDQPLAHLQPQQQQEGIAGKWIIEWGELVGLQRTEVEQVKAFISRTHDRARPAWGRALENQPRRAIFIATTNNKNYLKGDTNRRFWPVTVGRIDLDALARDRDQLWGEAAKREAQGEDIGLPKELWGAAREAQMERIEDDEWVDVLSDISGFEEDGFNGREERVSNAMIRDHLGKERGRFSVADTQRVALAMRRNGWKKLPKRSKIGGKVANGFFRSATDGDKCNR